MMVPKEPTIGAGAGTETWVGVVGIAVIAAGTGVEA